MSFILRQLAGRPSLTKYLASRTLGVKLGTSKFILAATGFESIVSRTDWAFSTVEVYLVYTKIGLGGPTLPLTHVTNPRKIRVTLHFHVDPGGL